MQCVNGHQMAAGTGVCGICGALPYQANLGYPPPSYELRAQRGMGMWITPPGGATPVAGTPASAPAKPLTVWQVFFSPSGRIGRQSYWLASLAAMAVFYFLPLVLVIATGAEGPFTIVIPLALLLASVTSVMIQIKRWHDRNKSGLMWLVSLIPLIGTIWVLAECGFAEGTLGPNAYGTGTNPTPFASNEEHRLRQISLGGAAPAARPVLDSNGNVIGWDESDTHRYLAENGLPSPCRADCDTAGHIHYVN